MVKIMEIRLPHYGRGYHLITQELLSRLPQLPENGLLNLFIKHTSAALTINENADPDVRLDFAAFFDRIVPDGASYFKHIRRRRRYVGTYQSIFIGSFFDYSDKRPSP